MINFTKNIRKEGYKIVWKNKDKISLDKELDELTCFERINCNGFKTNKDFENTELYNLEEDTTFYQMCLRKHKNWEYEK